MLNRILRPAIFAAVFLGAFRAGASQPKLVIGVYNSAGVPSKVLQAAVLLAHETFGAAGLETEWRIRDGGQTDSPDDLVVCILPRISPNVGSRYALGATEFEKGTGRALRAEAFYGAVQEITYSQQQAIVLLSNVIAHEVGHLLLGRAHAERGLMSPDWAGSVREIAQRITFRFDPDEVRRLRASAKELRMVAGLRMGIAQERPDSGLPESVKKGMPR